MAKKKVIIIVVAVLLAAAIGVSGFFVYKNVIVPTNKYNAAQKDFDAGKYEKAGKAFKKLGDFKDSKKQTLKCAEAAVGGKETFEKITALAVGDVFTFGTYEQDGDLTNGAEPLEWLVLDKKGNKVYLLCKNVIDAMPFSTEGPSWAACTYRTWLNSEFIDTAFTKDEQKALIKTHLEPEISNDIYTENGGATDDRVFAMSAKEVEKYLPKSEEELAKEEAGNKKCRIESRAVFPTQYALDNNVYTNNSSKCAWWWLRDLSVNGSLGVNISTSGRTAYGDNSISNTTGGVRPAMWLGADF